MSKTASPWWWTLVRLTVSVGLLVLLVLWVDPTKLGPALQQFNWSWTPAIWLAILVSVWLSAWKWGLLLRGPEGCMGWWDLFGTYTAGLFFNNFLPSSIGGDGARILLAAKFGFSKPTAAASVVVERALATVSLGLLGLVTGLLSAHPHPLAIALLGGVGLIGLLLTWLLLAGRLPGLLQRGQGRWARGLVAFAASSGQLRHRPRALVGSFVLAIAFQIAVAAVIGLVMVALGLPLPGPVDLVFVVSASSVLAMVPLGLNGYGLREGAFIVLLAPYGLAPAAALFVSILFAIAVSIYSLPGAVYWTLRRPKPAACPLPQGVTS